MPSIVEGYNYDVFISYRQKDNKGDRWVSEFVEALKTELESTFKEEISVYFDINPHDGLLETHDVDESLKEKLKCLVFIPILSRTYCDPKSFAWENELKAFVRHASGDQFGLKIKLPSGNVASRVLPVRIHDLEAEDVKLFGKVTGGYMRTLDFVFKTSSGVNRPLRSNEDHPGENINKIYYQDQINKAALGIKEIIQGMKAEPVPVGQGNKWLKKPTGKIIKERINEVQKKPFITSHRKLLNGIIAGFLVLAAAWLVYQKITKRNTLDEMRSTGEKISVAVMPFQNMTNDTSWNVWQDGIQDILITYLSNSPEELQVRQTELIDNLIKDKGITSYATITPSVAGSISQKLDANIFVYGSIKEAGGIVRVSAQLIDSRTKEVIKSFEIDGPFREDLVFQITDSLKRMVKNYLIISKLENELPAGHRYFQSTNSPEAFRYYIYGQKAFYKKDFLTAIRLYSRATAIDSNFVSAYFSLGVSYGNQGMLEEAVKLILKFYPKRDQLPMNLKVRLESYYASCFETPFEEIKYLKQLQELDDQNPVNYYNLGEAYIRVNQYDKAITELEKALAIYKKWGTKPLWAPNYALLGLALHKTGQYKKEAKCYKKAEQDFPDDIELNYRQAVFFLTRGDMDAGTGKIDKLGTMLRENSYSEAETIAYTGRIYSEAGFQDQAEKYFRKALSLDPGNPAMLNHLAWFLIDSNRNIKEGLDIIEKALELKPEDHVFLYTRGCGLYKQGKNKEAYDILRKSWDIRRRSEGYDHTAFLLLQDVKKAAEGQN